MYQPHRPFHLNNFKMSQTEILHSYRHLLRNLIRGVNDAKKPRITATQQLRRAFRDPNGVYDPLATKRTVTFLKLAAETNGVEHKILKNLIEVRRRKEEKLGDWKATLRKKEGKGKSG